MAKQTFKEILNNTKSKHAARIMKKARTANRIAKRVRGKNRRNAYKVKADALKFLVEKMPNRVEIREDITLNEFVIIELLDEQSALHTPKANLQRI